MILEIFPVSLKEGGGKRADGGNPRPFRQRTPKASEDYLTDSRDLVVETSPQRFFDVVKFRIQRR
jgi:hypothetical protein